MDTKDNRKEIATRDDIHHLVSTFYAKVRRDELIGPIFNGTIAEGEWPAHIDRLTDFWETNAFGMSHYRGDPRAVHQDVDRAHGGSITQAHFSSWLKLWIETVDDLFLGARAEGVKQRARRMSTGLYVGIFQARMKNESRSDE